MKKIYVTKQQLEEVLGADFNYLTNDNGIKTNCGGDEVFASSAMGKEELPKPTIGDKIGNSRTPRTYLGGHYVRTSLNCSKENKKKLVTEVNSELKNNKYVIPDNIYSTLQNNLYSIKNKENIAGSQRLKNLVNSRNVSYSEMYRLKGHFNKLDKKSNEYRLLGGQEMEQWVNNKLNNDMAISYNSKQLKKDMGINNAFIKSHEKTYGNGKAHTKSGVTFSYEE